MNEEHVKTTQSIVRFLALFIVLSNVACDCSGMKNSVITTQSTRGGVVVSGPSKDFSTISMQIVYMEGSYDSPTNEGAIHIIAEAPNRQQWVYGLEIRGYMREQSQKEQFKGVCAVRYLSHGRATEVDYDVHEAHVEKRVGLTMSLVCEKRFEEKRSGEPQAPQLPKIIQVAMQGVTPHKDTRNIH